MTKLTTERLEKFVNDIKTDGMCDITDSQVESALIRLLAYEQAAKNPVAWRVASFAGLPTVTFYEDVKDSMIANGQTPDPLYAAPVLPKQPELLSIGELLQRLEEQTSEKWVRESEQPVSEPYKLNGWISVDNELPEEGARVFVFSDGAFVLLAEFTGGEFYDVVRDGEEFFETVTRCVTHWMPLPAAPAQESE